MGKVIAKQTPFERSADLFMAMVCAISLLALTGWLINLPVLASLSSKYIPMAPASALLFLGLFVTWFLKRILSSRRWIRILLQIGQGGMLVLVLILAFRYFTGLGPDLEHLLYPNPGFFGQILTARMSPLSALGFFLAIPAFLLLAGREPDIRYKRASAGLSLALLVLSGIIIFGYLFGAPLFYGGTLIPVAVTSALAFLFLSLALLMMAGPDCWPLRMYVGTSLKARLRRAFIPATILIVMFQGLFSSTADPLISNPGLKVAVAVVIASMTAALIISLIAKNISAEIERNDQARLQTESTLKQSEARFRTLVETAHDAIINIDKDGHIVFWNRAAETMFGYSAAEMNDRPLDSVMPEGFRIAHQLGMERVVLTGDTHIIGSTVEVSGLRRDGSEFPLELSLATWQVGGEVFFTGIAHDITERKRGADALRKSELSLQAVLQSTADGILAVGSENQVLYANDRFAEIWRIPPEVLASKDDSLLLQNVLDQLSDPDSFLKKVQELYKSKEESFDILDFKDGRVFERLSRPLLQEESVRGRVWSFRDITESRRTADALGQSEAELRALFAGMTDVVIVYDIDGRYVEIAPTNPANLFRPPDEMLGKKIHDILPKEQADYIVGKIREAIQSGQVVSADYSLQINGKDTWFSASVSQLSNTTAVWVAHDITRRKRSEMVQNAIFRISQAAMTSEGIDSLYQSIHSILGELVPANNFYISLYDSASGLISFPYYVDQFDEPPPAPTPLQGLTGYVIRSGYPLLAPPEVFNRLVGQGDVEVVGTTGLDWMGAPLKVEGRTIGVMAVQSYTQGIHFNQEDLDLLEFVSTQVAQTIERKRMEEEIRSLSVTDELTGLYNRRGFTLLAEQEIKLAQRFKRSVLLFFADVDNLKMINDSLGHAQGDLALKEIAVILKGTFREADIPARIGGDEFVVLAPDASMETSNILTNRIQANLERRNQQGNRPYQLTISVGITCYDPQSPSSVSELIAKADAQMYEKKQKKKGKK